MPGISSALKRFKKIRIRRALRFRIWRAPRFRNEKRIVSGRDVRTGTTQPSILFATMHKAASVFVWSILAEIASDYRYGTADFDGYFYHQGKTRHPLRSDYFKETGMFYGPFRRGFEHIGDDNHQLDLNSFKVILQLRDPRDVLTSSYYSFLHSHAVPRKDRKRMQAVRNRLSRQNITDHVRAQTEFFYQLLNRYSRLFTHPNCLVLHYEDMTLRPEKWGRQLLDFLEPEDETAARRTLKKVTVSADDVPDVIQLESHKRRVTPGEFREVLPTEVIARLNERFSEYFAALQAVGELPANYESANYQNQQTIK
ncbi:MAG: sulfotransferase domain-containing protein [Planctomycetota bacterium]